jgi:superfamily II DNA or RNA helicase
LIADECHNFGRKSFLENKFNNFNGRLGLSATPKRWWDEEGTSRIFNYFDKVVYEYNIEKAIQNEYLVPYEYNPIIVNLEEKELEAYIKFSLKIAKALNSNNEEDSDIIQKLNIQRSLIISKAIAKKELLYKLLAEENKDELAYTLVYCAPGEINEITRKISLLGYIVHKFDSTINNKERQKILDAFKKKQIQILVAIKCLDEGVDIPNAKNAYFLSSTSNPREFVQRRGRVLRKSKCKNYAKIYDFIVLPENINKKTFTNIASKELPRFAEFSAYSINKYVARNKIRPILEKYELEYLMDKLPWEVYQDIKENRSRYGY